ncbi:hypothetical protein [Cellulomonas composti]|uniref:Lipoprotein n=1 Tax=Cellulomonas composti TaxID=266130 RepID=A0A511JDH5_9CELL|nr:hypothetical protein [Cellulomonas composti]GEL96047.1 hypothetical protein CCO02nite_27050 [Cellulomonas composti]
MLRVRGAVMVGVVLVIALSGGCTSGGEPSLDPIADFPERIAPIVDTETGEVARGSFRFTPSFFDDNNLLDVVEHARVACYRANGYEGDQMRWRPAQEVMKNHSYVGVWRVEDAEQFAFTTPTSPADMLLNGVENSVMSDADRAAAQSEVESLSERLAATKNARKTEAFKVADEACAKDPEVVKWQKLVDGGAAAYRGPWDEDFRQAELRAFEDPRMDAIEDDFASCLEASGLQGVDPQTRGYDNKLGVEGAEYAINEQQITLALIAVECKATIDAANRMMDLVAEYEAPVYLKYQAELDDRAAEVAEQRAAVADYWAHHSS